MNKLDLEIIYIVKDYMEKELVLGCWIKFRRKNSYLYEIYK